MFGELRWVALDTAGVVLAFHRLGVPIGLLLPSAASANISPAIAINYNHTTTVANSHLASAVTPSTVAESAESTTCLPGPAEAARTATSSS